MTTITLSSNTLINAWESSAATADVTVGGVTLTGTAAAAYHFGKALQTVKYQGLLDGVQLTDARFEFPPASGQWVSLPEVADALHYKYGVDPLIEFAPGLGQRGYSVADINAILSRLNQEFQGQFSLNPVTSSTVANNTRLTFDAEKLKSPVIPTATATGSTDEYLTFANDPNWSTGTPVRVSRAGAGLLPSTGGLLENTDYFLRNLGAGKYSVFTTPSAASGTSTTGRVDLTANVTAFVSYSPPRVTAANVSDEWVQFSTDPAWLTGTSVRVSASGGGLLANTDYFIRNLGGGKYSFFTSSAASAGTATTGRVDLRDGILSTTTASFSVDTTNTSALASLLDTTSTAAMAPATEAELRRNLTDGGDLYVDRRGAYFINGVPTTAKDVAVVSRLLAQDNISSEYKVLMDDYAERNNLIASARSVLDGGSDGLAAAIGSVKQQYGTADVLSVLTSGQYSDAAVKPRPRSTDTVNNTITFFPDPSWTSGMSVRPGATGGGLTDGVRYYVKNLGSGEYELHSTSNLSGSAVDLTEAIKADITPDYGTPKWPVVQAVSGQVGSDYKTFKLIDDIAEWNTGTKVRILGTVTGLVAGTDYYLRRDQVSGYYGLFDTLANAVNTDSETGRKLFGSNLSSKEILERDVVMLSGITDWPDGTKIRATSTAGGLTAGTDYYVRKLGTDSSSRTRYNLFETADQASATGTPRPTAGLVAITGDIGDFNFLTRPYDALDFGAISALLNTLISNKVRDGDLDQAKLQTLTAQLQNNTEAMTALIKVFSDLNATLVQALR